MHLIKIRTSLQTSLVVFFWLMFFNFILPSRALAQQANWGGVCVGGPGAEDVATLQGLECLIANVFTVILGMIGMAAFVMFVVGSFSWLLSGGNSQQLEKARKSLTFAVIGIVVALSSFVIINLIAAFTGVNVIKSFVIPSSWP